METIKDVRQAAANYLNDYDYRIFESPTRTLLEFPWRVGGQDPASQTQYATWNLELNPHSCLGKTAIAGLLCEKHFPDTELQGGEVLQDFFRDRMREQVNKNLPKDPQLKQEWIEELLMYENPHSILLVEGKQFDPLFTPFDSPFTHPEVRELPFWEHVLASVFVAKSFQEHDLEVKLEKLDEASSICPNMLLSKEVRAGVLLSQQNPKGIKLLREVQKQRPTADNLFALWVIDGYSEESPYRRRLEEEYTEEVIRFLKRKHKPL
jgi:hypothetical protein